MVSINNFHFIRLIASVMVVFSHSFYLFSSDSIDPLHAISGGVFTFGNLGVYIFLIVSGYLITSSILRSFSVLNFLWRRLLRVLPGLWGMVILSVFLFAPLLSSQGFKDYFTDSSNFNFLKNLFLFYPNNFKIPSVFTSNSNGTFNGSLWTIAYEVFFYLVITVFFISKIITKRYFILIQWIFLLIIQFYLGHKIFIYSYSTPWLLNLNIENFFRLFIYFESGVILYLFKDLLLKPKFIVSFSIVVFVLFLILNLGFINFDKDGVLNPMMELVLPPLIIYFAISNNKFSFIEKYGDFSYGIYLYSYIVQQSIMSFKFSFMNEYILFFISLIISFVIAHFSWNYIEKRAINYKNAFK